jgi:hypothetical protein
MIRELLKLIDNIKDEVRSLDDEGVSHPKIDLIYEQLTELEDILYENDNSTGSAEEDYYD